MKKNLTEEFTDKIQYKIITGELKAGDRLPPLRELAKLYEVSRSVINASVAELESLGYITVLPRKGIVINDWKREGTLGVLQGVAKFNAFDRDTLVSLLESRLCVECECARLAASRATEQEISKLYEMIKKGRVLEELAKRTDYDRAFHHTIALMSGNIINGLIIKSFERYSEALLELFYEEDNVFGFVIEKHLAICDAISARQPQIAGREMEALLKHGEEIILRICKGGKYGNVSGCGKATRQS